MKLLTIVLRIVIISSILPLRLYAVEEYPFYKDSLLHVTGARGWIPCKDGSLIGPELNCGNLTSQTVYCSQPVVSRSWNGGVTWQIENTNAPDFSSSGLIRLRGGDLLSSHNRWFGGFILSTDDGRSWYPQFDSTKSDTAYFATNTEQMRRDFRGILYWFANGYLYYSLDSGKSRVSVPNVYTREVYYVLPPNGLIVTRMIQAGTDPSEIRMSFDHGRTWKATAKEYDNSDSSMSLDGMAVINDTVFILTFNFNRPNGPYDLYTRFWSETQRQWIVGRFRGECWFLGAMLDSADNWYGWSESGFYKTKAGDSTCVRIVRASDTLFPRNPADSMLPVSKASVEGMFYDLDGNVHPNGSTIVISTNERRPVSRIDRLYYCNGIEYVIGGRHLESMWLEPSQTQNATLTYTITPNSRLATVEVNVVDTTLPMYFSLMVEDVLWGQQRFVDSLLPNGNTPKLKPLIYPDGTAYRIRCEYRDGPYMWYKDGVPMQKPGKYRGNVVGDSVILWPEPGRYMVRGRNNNGCDVFSEEVSIGITDVFEEGSAARDAFQVITQGNEIRVRGTGESETVTVAAFDLLGKTLNLRMVKVGPEYVIPTDDLSGIIILLLSDSLGNQARRIVLVQ